MKQPVGILDSGSGGLSIWHAFVTRMPLESTVYIGDHANIPYSEKSQAFIRSRTVDQIRFLIAQQAKLIIVACNTATVAGIEYYREIFSDIPIIGVVSVIKTAVSETRSGSILVLSTKYTARSMYQKKLIQKFGGNCQIFSVGSSRLVLMIEAGDIQSKHITNELSEILAPYLNRNIDIVALGCTHFPFIRSKILEVFGGTVRIVDSGLAVARQAERILIAERSVESKTKATHAFYTNGDEAQVTRTARTVLGGVFENQEFHRVPEFIES